MGKNITGTILMTKQEKPHTPVKRGTTEHDTLASRSSGRRSLPAAYPKNPEGLKDLEAAIKALGAEALGQRHGVTKEAVVKLRQRRRKEVAALGNLPLASSKAQNKFEGVATVKSELPPLVISLTPIYNNYKGWRQIVRDLTAQSPEELADKLSVSTEELLRHRDALQALAEDEGWGIPNIPVKPFLTPELLKLLEEEFSTRPYTDTIHTQVGEPVAVGEVDFDSLKEAATRLAVLGLKLQTIISIELPASEYPMRRKNHAGQWEVKRGLDGKPIPAYSGKNPSFWQIGGTPKLDSQKKSISLQEVLRRLDVAERSGKPIGLAVIPSTDVVVIDFDLKHYSSQEALDADWLGLLDRHPELRSTRIERTAGGGVHIYLKVADSMASWRKPSGNLYCNFSTTVGGPHRGEVLAGTRVSVCAPTQSGNGNYEIVNPSHAFELVEIETLAAIDIHPSVQAGERPARSSESDTARKATQSPPRLVDLLGVKAKKVLAGEHPYGVKGDRSMQLTGFLKELYSWVNLLQSEGLAFSGSTEDLIQQAVVALNIEDKVDRVFDSVIPSECTKRDPENALRLYRQLAQAAASAKCIKYGSALQASQSAVKLSLAERLNRLLNEGRSGAELSLLLKALADDVGSPMRDVERLYGELEAEQERAAETSRTLDELVRLNESAEIDLQALIPSDLLEVLEAMRAFADYRLDVLLAVLMTGLSGALPLDSRIELNAMERFNQPLSLWALLLMPSGEAKSPLLQRLLALPWREAVDAELANAYAQRRSEWEAAQQLPQEGEGRAEALPRPRKPQTLVTEDVTVQGMETHIEIHDQWANRSMCIWLDEGKGALKQMVDRDSGTGKETPFGGWLLSRYDGTGARGAKADQTRERNYKSCRLSMVTCCQPDVYRAITGDGDQTGLSARFIVVEQNLVEQDFPTSVDPNAVVKADQLHDTLVRCYLALAQIDQLKLWLSEEAFELFQLERKAMYERKRESNSAAERALANKVAGRLGRLAGMFHIIWCLMGPKGGPRLGRGGEVSGENMQRAILFNRLLLDQTLGVRLTSADNSELGGLMLKLHRRAWEVKKPMPVGDLRKGLTSNNRPEMAVVVQSLQELARHGFGELSELEYRGQRGWRYTALKPLLEVGSRHP